MGLIVGEVIIFFLYSRVIEGLARIVITVCNERYVCMFRDRCFLRPFLAGRGVVGIDRLMEYAS